MPTVIKDGAILPRDRWTVLREATGPEVLQAVPGRSFIVPLEFWLNFRAQLEEYPGERGVWLDSHQTPKPIEADLAEFAVIGLNFPVFADGRSYSNARELRERYRFEGEIRAIGDVMRDQLYYMSRCGFNSFALRHDQDPETCLRALKDFSTGYQSSIDEPLPLFRRRGGVRQE
ncbi:MAG: DUF934 domain-containing protein [Gammaproteobacteria bacterium]|nr:DUF934 domain-containing protein [Gammaproteobacteria bacterium]MYH86014.1 DUF934 domain-containing protein [Gammaproteobacteria bacterium]MYK04127.1 DUF934 domain-containing protein [Gammaproteobacteria bacterium]